MSNKNEPPLDASSNLTFRHLTPAAWNRWKRLMRENPQWFVLRKPLWMTGRWQAVAGPFASRRSAQRMAEKLMKLPAEQIGPAPAPEYEFQVAPLTETMRIYNSDAPQLANDLTAAQSSSRVDDV